MHENDESRLGNVLIGATGLLVVTYVLAVTADALLQSQPALADELAVVSVLASGSLHLWALAVIAVVLAVGVYRTYRGR